MNERQQTCWPSPSVTVLFHLAQVPMARHISHPHTAVPLCGARGTWEAWATSVEAFDPAAWRGCAGCGQVLAWLVEEGERIPSCLAAMRQLLGDPTFGPQPVMARLLRHGGDAPTDVLPILAGNAPVSVWRENLRVSARGAHGTLIEAGIDGHIFPPSELVVLATNGGPGVALHLSCLDARDAVGKVRAAGATIHCVITPDRGPYWDRALYHL